ncbi:hypothetical protein ACWKWZ_27385 [Metapseudomonas otitidis]|uniref:hypothetical protein n=1 Tax=Metapseudomonas otitidis TaxID=319939 RepID=UPI0025410467|nr:hypothetical protein [Pseudomonas otitidis]WIF65648.1 hypothetical protein QN096_17920 [Pseudomonas otitidis]
MQFQLTVLCLGIHRVEVGGRVCCFASIAREPATREEHRCNRGYLVQQVTAEMRVFEEVGWLSAPTRLSFMCSISEEPGGSYRPHLLALCH